MRDMEESPKEVMIFHLRQDGGAAGNEVRNWGGGGEHSRSGGWIACAKALRCWEPGMSCQDQVHTEVGGGTGKGQGPGESGLQPKDCGSLWKV